MVGRGVEQPEVVKEMLDIKNKPNKPNYDYAAPEPLMLFDSDYGDTDMKFHYTASTFNSLSKVRNGAVIIGNCV